METRTFGTGFGPTISVQARHPNPAMIFFSLKERIILGEFREQIL